jgi:hypothetical protein
MAAVPRKVLLVKRPPPDTGYNVMLEVEDRTLSMQVPNDVGEEIMTRVQDIIVEIGVQRGLGNTARKK